MSPAERYPRVLVLAQNRMQPFTGGGVLLSSLFADFPKSHVFFLHRDQEYGVPAGYGDHRLTWMSLRLDLKALFTHFAVWCRAALRAPRAVRPRDALALILASAWFEIPRAADVRIRQLRPQIIYAWTADSLWARTLARMSARYRVPHVIHFMDNHVGIEPRSPRAQSLARVFRAELAAVAGRAAAIYTISDSMGRAYQRYWEKPFEVYRGVIDPSAWPWCPPETRSSDGVFRLGFAGSTDRSQLLGLREVAKAVESLVLAGREVRLVLYLTPAYATAARKMFADLSCVEFRRHPEKAAFRTELLSMDALVLAYSFDKESIDYYRYSFATKIAPYMLSGRPILVFGPAEVEPVKYASRGAWALIVDRPERHDIVDAIERLMSDERLRERLARDAWEAARTEHDERTQSARFIASLIRFAES